MLLKGSRWRHVRNTVSPTFSTGRLKKVCSIMENNARVLRDKLELLKGLDQEMKEVMSCYTMDVIAGAGFGVDTDAINDPDSPFIKEGKHITGNITDTAFAFLLTFPWLFNWLGKLGLGILSKKTIKFFNSFVDAALENRAEAGEGENKRSDFIQLMVDDRKKKGADKRPLTHVEFQGQAFIFISGGLDTVATALSFLFFLLAHNSFATKKIQEELDEVLKGDFPSYESVQTMTYLEMCLFESMRLYPAGFVTDRMCTQDCVVQGINIRKGTCILIPFVQLFRDPKQFPEPMKFDPERHSAENKQQRHPFAFLPFGQGPRNCIGMRLALLEMKIAIAAILQKMTPLSCSKSVNPPKVNKFQMGAESGLWVKFVTRGQGNK